MVLHPQGKCWALHSPKSLPAELTVLDSLQHPQPICHLHPNEGIAVIGVVQAFLGNQKLTLMALQAKATVWEVALRQGFLPQSLTWMALQKVIWPSLRYPLAVTSFLETQALSIVSKLYHTLFPCLGANRYYPLDL